MKALRIKICRGKEKKRLLISRESSLSDLESALLDFLAILRPIESLFMIAKEVNHDPDIPLLQLNVSEFEWHLIEEGIIYVIRIEKELSVPENTELPHFIEQS